MLILISATVRYCFSWAWLAGQEGQPGLTSGAGKRQNLARDPISKDEEVKREIINYFESTLKDQGKVPD